MNQKMLYYGCAGKTLQKNDGCLPSMDKYRESLLRNGGIHFSYCNDIYNRMRFKISDEWTMPVTEKAISDIDDFVKTDFYDKWIMREGTVYFDKE